MLSMSRGVACSTRYYTHELHLHALAPAWNCLHKALFIQSSMCFIFNVFMQPRRRGCLSSLDRLSQAQYTEMTRTRATFTRSVFFFFFFACEGIRSMAIRDPAHGLESPSTLFKRQKSVIITYCTVCTVLVCVRCE